MKSLIVVLLCALLLGGAIWITYRDISKPAPEAVTVKSAAIANTLKPTRTPKPEATATPDMLLLAQSTRAALDVELAQARNTAEMAAVTATAIIAETHATETQRAWWIDGTQTAAAAQKTQVAYSTERREMIALATADRSLTLTPAALAEHRDRIVNEFLPVLGCVVIVGMAGLFGLMAYGIVRILNVKYQTAVEEREEAREAREYERSQSEPPAPVVTEMPSDDYPAGISRRLLNSIATDEQLAELARLVLRGTPLTHNNFTPTENLLSEGRFRSLQVTLVNYGYAAWDDNTHKGGVTLTARGWQLMRKLTEDAK